MDGALLVNKHAGVSSFGVIEELQRALMAYPGAYGRKPDEPFARKRDLPKMGHGGTLDPFATGLLAVCVGRGVKLARYFLGSRKSYEGVIRFGETTVPGDPTAPISERSEVLPDSLLAIQNAARTFALAPYLQTPPMHSAKKVGGKPLYELARQGIEIEREPRLLTIYSFEILGYENSRAAFRVDCSSGTYIRTLAKDLAAKLGTVAMLDSLNRLASGIHSLHGDAGASPCPARAHARAMSVQEILAASAAGQRWDELPAWAPFDRLLDGYPRAEATGDEAVALFQGRQAVLSKILSRTTRTEPKTRTEDLPPGEESDPIAVYHAQTLIAIARQDHGAWGLERVFTPGD